MILGIGIDIIENDRIRKVIARYGDRFLSKILTRTEMENLPKKKIIPQRIAAIFASKEAFSKAFGTGIGRELSWLDMEIHHLPSGKPYLTTTKTAHNIHLSISHERQNTIAMVIIEKNISV